MEKTNVPNYIFINGEAVEVDINTPLYYMDFVKLAGAKGLPSVTYEVRNGISGILRPTSDPISPVGIMVNVIHTTNA